LTGSVSVTHDPKTEISQSTAPDGLNAMAY
jgi:hypothetical protein